MSGKCSYTVAEGKVRYMGDRKHRSINLQVVVDFRTKIGITITFVLFLEAFAD